MINSAQRVINLDQPRSNNVVGLEQLQLNIQGLTLHVAGKTTFYSYSECADLGVHQGLAKPLSLFQRLMRQQAPLGVLEWFSETTVDMTFWTPIALSISFDLGIQEQAVEFRETEIMVMSAGFHFQQKLPDDR